MNPRFGMCKCEGGRASRATTFTVARLRNTKHAKGADDLSVRLNKQVDAKVAMGRGCALTSKSRTKEVQFGMSARIGLCCAKASNDWHAI